MLTVMQVLVLKGIWASVPASETGNIFGHMTGNFRFRAVADLEESQVKCRAVAKAPGRACQAFESHVASDLRVLV
jgi:hypothetical protein